MSVPKRKVDSDYGDAGGGITEDKKVNQRSFPWMAALYKGRKRETKMEKKGCFASIVCSGLQQERQFCLKGSVQRGDDTVYFTSVKTFTFLLNITTVNQGKQRKNKSR